MEYESRRKVQSIILWTISFALQYQVCFTDARQLQNETGVPAESPTPSPSSYYFLVEGDPLQNGFISATVQVGNGLKQFFLDIDTGSDLTWITCSPTNIKFLKPLSLYPTPNDPYVTNDNLVSCVEASICGFVEKPINPQCSEQNQQCDYQVEYADHGTTLGVLVEDSILLSSSLNGNPLQSTPNLTFGCGYHQEFSASLSPPFADGVLGLGSGETSILSQLSGQGLIKKVMALCSSDKYGPGYLVLGDSLSNLPYITWRSLLNNPGEPNNMLGPVDILYDGENLLASQFQFLLDSGTTYSYFSPIIYQAVLSQVKELAAQEGTPVEGSVSSYLLEPTFLYNRRLVIYDYENQKIGWSDTDCSDLPAQLASIGPDTNSAKKRMGEWHKGEDAGSWHMRKKRKQDLNSP
ncbi:Peptidase A1 domain-containing protein [Forsythia ovata]|uniref:Peptidase A1 domain-containing protein n=1 Tax=Forsythia ovata TaxID=205694 RepID=A0ABD1PV00_9LAMI